MKPSQLILVLETLIVWTEPDGVDYALSFQEAEGCAEVWNFIAEVQQHMKATGEQERFYCFVPQLTFEFRRSWIWSNVRHHP